MRDQRDRAVDNLLILHAFYLDLILSTTVGPQSTIKGIPEHRELSSISGMITKQKTKI